MSQIYISAAHKSSGKTTVSIGLCAALVSQNKTVQAYKKGPDYIDPHWLSKATKRDCFNLDFYTMHEDEIKEVVGQYSADADISIIEGNKGLYDGLDLDGSNSNAALAKLLNTPIILVLDARGMTRGIAPLILGYQAFDNDINIKGVILNQLGGSRHESKLRSVIEHYTDVEVLGAIHRDTKLDIEERHLGLMPSNEDNEASKKIDALKQSIIEQVNLDAVIEIANQVPKLDKPALNPQITVPDTKPVTIGIVKNTAFGFYYPDDLIAMQSAGASLVEIDNINDTSLPDINGLFIGGGFPETHMAALESNQTLRTQIRDAIDDGLPVYAECGGLMYLARSISWNNKTHKMVGAIDADIQMEEKPQGRGYVQLKETGMGLWPSPSEKIIPAHEFHFSRFINLDKDAKFAYQVVRGTGINGQADGYIRNNMMACYSHQRSTGGNNWAARFIEFVQNTL